MYVHFIDVNIIVILIRNDKNVFVKILRNYRLNRVFKLDFFNVFHIEKSNDVKHFALKKQKNFIKMNNLKNSFLFTLQFM